MVELTCGMHKADEITQLINQKASLIIVNAVDFENADLDLHSVFN